MLCNIPSFLNKSGLTERQFLARGEVVHGAEYGGKLFSICPTLWDTLAVYLQPKGTPSNSPSMGSTQSPLKTNY